MLEVRRQGFERHGVQRAFFEERQQGSAILRAVILDVHEVVGGAASERHVEQHDQQQHRAGAQRIDDVARDCRYAVRSARRRQGYRILRNRVYIGLGVHKGVAYPGEHASIISQSLWDKAQSILRESPRVRANHSRATTPALLKGLLFGPTGRAMSLTHTRRGSKLYRYYICQTLLKGEVENTEIQRVSAASIEAAVVDQLRVLLKSPVVVVATWRAAKAESVELSEATVREALNRLDPLWAELFPAEQARIVQLLVQRVDLKPDGLELRLRTHGGSGTSSKSLACSATTWGRLHEGPARSSRRHHQNTVRCPQARARRLTCCKWALPLARKRVGSVGFGSVARAHDR